MADQATKQRGRSYDSTLCRQKIRVVGGGPGYCHPEVSKYDGCPRTEDCWYDKLTASAENIFLMLNGTNWLFCFTPPCNDESFLFMGSVCLRPDGWPEKVVWTRISQETLDDLQAGIRGQTGIIPWFMQGFENEEQMPAEKQTALDLAS